MQAHTVRQAKNRSPDSIAKIVSIIVGSIYTSQNLGVCMKFISQLKSVFLLAPGLAAFVACSGDESKNFGANSSLKGIGNGFCYNTGADAGLNIRSAPSTSGQVLGLLPINRNPNTIVASDPSANYLCSEPNGWHKISYVGPGWTVEGYSSGAYLSCYNYQYEPCETLPVVPPPPPPPPVNEVSCPNSNPSQSWVAHYFNDSSEQIWSNLTYFGQESLLNSNTTKECLYTSAAKISKNWGLGSPDHRIWVEQFTAAFLRYNVKLTDVSFQASHDDKLAIMLRPSSNRSAAFVRYHENVTASALYGANLRSWLDGTSPNTSIEYDVLVVLKENYGDANIDLTLPARVKYTAVINVCANPEQKGKFGQKTDGFDFVSLMDHSDKVKSTVSQAAFKLVDREDGSKIWSSAPVVTLVFDFFEHEFESVKNSLRVRRSIHGQNQDGGGGYYHHTDVVLEKKEFQVIDLGADFNQDGKATALRDNGACDYWSVPGGFDKLIK